MILCMIAAMAKNRVIGKDNALPWSYPEDLKRFKEITLWSPVIMGQNTFLSIGKKLPWRRNIVITRSDTFPDADIEVYHDPELVIDMLETEMEAHEPAYIIWWESLYRYFLPHTEYLYLTEIKKNYEWDRFFPEFEDEFEEIERTSHEAFDFVTYRKKRVD